MARTIPKKLTQSQKLDFMILRAAKFSQNLPAEAILGGGELIDRVSVLIKFEYLIADAKKQEITELGNKYLLKLTGGVKPPMIDQDESVLLSKDEKLRPIKIKKSLVKEILQSASFGGPS